MLFAFLLAFWAITLSLYYLWSRREYYRVAYQLPGPMVLPFVGLGLNMLNPEVILPFMEKLSCQYVCPFISWMGTNCFLYVNDPETVEAVFNSPHCTNKGDFYRFMSSAIGDGLFTSSSPRWNKHRRLINPAFSRQVIYNFLPIFNAEANVFLDKLAVDGICEGQQLEIYQMLKKIVLEAACQTTMGKKMNFQEDGSSAIFNAYNGITEVCVTRMLSPWLYPDAIYRHSSLCKREQKLVNVLFAFVEKLLGSQSDVIETEPGASDAEKYATAHVDLLRKVPEVYKKAENVKHEEEVESNEDIVGRKSKSIFIEQMRGSVERGLLSLQDVRDEANVAIAATFETTSTALYFTILCLAMHPEYQDKLHAELVKLFPYDAYNDDNNTEPEDDMASAIGYLNVTNEHLDRMTYTEMVINEAMRLFAPVPIVLRRAEHNFTLPLPNGQKRRSVTIPRGTQIGIDIFNMQRSEAVWGENARAFRPDEHFGPGAATRHPFAFVPFTKGLRMCIGYRYALMLMKVLLAKTFRHYRIHTEAKMSDLIIKGTISLKLREYPLCTVERRSRDI